jgi:hypothetical protein
MLPKAVAQRALALCVCGQMINDSQLRTVAVAMVKGSRPPKHTLAHAAPTHHSAATGSTLSLYLSLMCMDGHYTGGNVSVCVSEHHHAVCIYSRRLQRAS